jgi:hypothetical protein
MPASQPGINQAVGGEAGFGRRMRLFAGVPRVRARFTKSNARESEAGSEKKWPLSKKLQKAR